MSVAPIQVTAVVNGPGEVAAWLYPFADALRSRQADVRLRAALLPCVFASGQETAVLDGMPGIDAVCTPSATLRWITRGEAPPGFDGDGGGRGCVVHFGGELLLSIALARRLRQPIVVYEEQRVRWLTLLDKVCVVNERVAGVNGNHKVRAVGNLMVDAARLRVPVRHTPNGGGGPHSVALFPGSRQYFVQQVLPFLMRVAALVERVHPGTAWILSKSDFITHDELERLVSGPNHRVLEGDDARWENGSRDVLVSSAGVRVRVASPAAAMAVADLAITIPGTSTAELAALGIPMILALPTYRLHTLPLPGLAGHLGGIPLLGPAIKGAVARTYVWTRRYWAHPNRLAGERIVPELVGPISAVDVAAQVQSSLRANGSGEMAQRLRFVMGEPGAAQRLVDEVLATVRT